MKPAAQIYYLDLGQTLDLRRRLVGYLGAMLLGLLLVTVLINLYSLRNDVTAEVIASEQLVRVLLDTDRIERDLPPAEAAIRLEAILNSGPLRHLTISIGAAPLPKSSVSVTGWLAGWPAYSASNRQAATAS